MKYDAIVVGGGPAGSFTSLKLAEKGLNVLLVERKSKNRYKPCGGGMCTRCLKLVGEPPAEVVEREVTKETLYTKTKKFSVSCSESDGKKGIVVYRNKFDAWLIDRAEKKGVEVLDKSKVDSIKLNGGVTVKLEGGQEYEAEILVGAWGASSYLYKFIGVTPPRYFTTISHELELPSSTIEEKIDGPEIYWDGDITTNGYFWIFPKKEGVSIGFTEKTKNAKGMKEKLFEIIHNHPIISQKLKGSKEMMMDGRSLYGHPMAENYVDRLHGNRFLLVGEAGGLVNFMTGEGIYYALKSAELAASVINEGDYSEKSLGRYTELCHSELIDNDLKYSAKMAKMMYGHNPQFYDRMMDAILELTEENSEIKKIMENMFSSVEYSQIYNPFMSKKGLLIRKLGLLGVMKIISR
ncbi:MAG: NAD(P)/FAD-dependent oxidoreductase [Candidatus Methanoperedens sp.]|nr:NAD(P)/FAD-dependent oxidoreductase [Candidatus Methanoperedens sp.]MCZ7371871.1 NAD(P)/FAD-dependent oxidoreductase [Candidatus Methanoperedens sp.]